MFDFFSFSSSPLIKDVYCAWCWCDGMAAKTWLVSEWGESTGNTHMGTLCEMFSVFTSWPDDSTQIVRPLCMVIVLFFPVRSFDQKDGCRPAHDRGQPATSIPAPGFAHLNHLLRTAYICMHLCIQLRIHACVQAQKSEWNCGLIDAWCDRPYQCV
jgi:hypothetical protein